MAGFPSAKKGNKLAEKARNPQKGTPLDKEQVKTLLTRFLGNVSKVADSMGCSRYSIQYLIDNDKDLADHRMQARQRFIDDLETSTWQDALEHKDPTMRIFLLKTIGKARGYEQDESKNAAQDIAKAAFDFVINKSKNPAEQ